VEGTSFETGEQHGRELLKKGYAEVDESKAKVAVDLNETSSPAEPLTSAGTDQKAGTKAKATEKKKAE
jgi:hypothetical protein